MNYSPKINIYCIHPTKYESKYILNTLMYYKNLFLFVIFDDNNVYLVNVYLKSLILIVLSCNVYQQ